MKCRRDSFLSSGFYVLASYNVPTPVLLVTQIRLGVNRRSAFPLH
jgi:hypothetical protein